jgi:hypothetical protein
MYKAKGFKSGVADPNELDTLSLEKYEHHSI